ncbi:hypothetical protein AX15_003094 [Amanita polypyramis BW_CC]|nr:hypothetical protein AX15_003094 [Amanita polypyramis BW_CC]
MSPVHLVVLVHGMWGNPSHLAEMRRVISETYPDPVNGMELQVLLAETNQDESTYDGIDWGGERVTQEIMDKIKDLQDSEKQVKRLSITGYSLGGLIGRYVVGILHQRGFFNEVEPVNFNTFATPHLGLPRYPSLLSRMLHLLGPKLLSRTGEQFYCVDRWSLDGRPLLEVMADPRRAFYQGLSLFKHIRIYANAVNDLTVPYVTAAIELEDPFINYSKNGVVAQLDARYEPVLAGYSIPSSPPREPPVFSREWVLQLKSRRPLLPPGLQRGFPLNMLIYVCIPFALPFVVMVIIINLSLASRSSRARLRLLEEDKSREERLVYILSRLERKLENPPVSLLEDTTKDLTVSSPEMPRSVLSPLQRKIAHSLNRLPLKKELAFISEVLNSHAPIVCRDVKHFEIHRRGEGVLRHWATSFIL